MYVGLRVTMSLLSTCIKVYFALRILVNSPLENFMKPGPVDAELFHANRPYVSFVISLLKWDRIAIKMKLL